MANSEVLGILVNVIVIRVWDKYRYVFSVLGLEA